MAAGILGEGGACPDILVGRKNDVVAKRERSRAERFLGKQSRQSDRSKG